MKNITLTALVSTLFFAIPAQAKEAPKNVFQLSAVYPEFHETESFPWFDPGTVSGGELSYSYRGNLKSEVILLELQFGLGGSANHPVNSQDTKVKSYFGVGLGPTVRANYGILNLEAGLNVGGKVYLFGYIPEKMDKDANGYALGSAGVYGGSFLRLGIGPVFFGGGFGIDNPLAGEPGTLKPAVTVNTNINKNDIMSDPNTISDQVKVDSSNVGKVERVSGKTRTNMSCFLGVVF